MADVITDHSNTVASRKQAFPSSILKDSTEQLLIYKHSRKKSTVAVNPALETGISVSAEMLWEIKTPSDFQDGTNNLGGFWNCMNFYCQMAQWCLHARNEHSQIYLVEESCLMSLNRWFLKLL